MSTHDLAQLPDDELRQQALAWRRLALQGAQHARGYAHECEVELRRRFGIRPANALHAVPDLPARTGRWRWWFAR